MLRRLILAGVMLACMVTVTAGFTGGGAEECVPTADHFQRYSWTGGPIPDDPAPAFPDANWQPNVEGDPHGIGHAGAYFVSHGASGGGDWFYLELIEGTDCPTPTTVPVTTVPPTTQTPPTSSIPDDDTPTGSLDVDKTVHGDPDCEADEPCFIIIIDCEDQVTRQQTYDRTGHLIDGPSTFHDIPSDDVCIVVETVTGGADSVTYDPPNASTTGVVITPEDPDSDVDQRVHVMVTNWFDPGCEVDCEPPPTTIPPPTTEPPTTTVPPPVCTVPTDCVPPPCFDPMCPPPTTDTIPPPPPTDPPVTTPTCEDDGGQPGCRELARTGSDLKGRAGAGTLMAAAGAALVAVSRRKRAA